jgi:creatinine amidohydrolase/Fe(II)-dependent formamide hydrolase-like protein
MVVNGFKHIVLIGDHGGGQKELETLAARMAAKYRRKGRMYIIPARRISRYARISTVGLRRIAYL